MGDLRKKIKRDISFFVVLALLLCGAETFATRGKIMAKARPSESIRSVYISYSKPGGIYKKAHKACRKFFNKDMAAKLGERVSYAVEIITMNPKIRKASALCVAKRYTNDNVVAGYF